MSCLLSDVPAFNTELVALIQASSSMVSTAHAERRTLAMDPWSRVHAISWQSSETLPFIAHGRGKIALRDCKRFEDMTSIICKSTSSTSPPHGGEGIRGTSASHLVYLCLVNLSKYETSCNVYFSEDIIVQRRSCRQSKL